ncbi:MAG TPA: nickel pincer cofactor biosynthesis protein LarC, partial [Gemmatimonadales bacterium]
MTARFAIIDPAAGISGDMLLGALVDAGAPPEWLRGLPERLRCPEVTIGIEEVDRCGVRARRVVVRLPGGLTEGPGEAHARGHVHAHPLGHGHEHGHEHHAHASPADHAHHGEHAHRHVGDLIAMIEEAPLSPWVRERAVRAFELLGEAEGRIHGVPPREVALHEVGALDALVDIVGGIEGFEQLGISRIYAWPVALGEGWVRAAHGVIPVPAPATAILVEGLEVRSNGPVAGEATTPTGAVLLRVLAEGPPPARWRAVQGAAWGAGGRDPGAYPNALRLLICEGATEAGEVVALTTDVDDLTPEYVEALREALLAAGALDVQTWATHGKKGRASFRLEALAAPGEAASVEEALFRHSTTIGLRRTTLERRTLPRRTIEVRAEDGSAVRVKVRDLGDGISAKPEYDDIIELARRVGRPAHELARELQDRAVRSAADQAGASRVN